jgi:phospholipid/cholesterol/gamma-HCH transport system permease protein
MSRAESQNKSGVLAAMITAVGKAAIGLVYKIAGIIRYLGGGSYLLYDTVVWILRSLFFRTVRMRWAVLAGQMVRVGVRAIGIVLLIQVFIGLILALQMAPTLERYGQLERVADITGIAIFRELGPLMTAVVLSGFAGASIAAEIGSMTEAEEIKALRAHALNPIRFLVMPRVLATIIMMVCLTVLADVSGVTGGLLTSWLVLDIPPRQYLHYTQAAVVYKDFFTGLVKAGVFGLLISVIACYEGLSVSGGAEGVGRATTSTVVKSIVVLIATDSLFTTVFYLFGL